MSLLKAPADQVDIKVLDQASALTDSDSNSALTASGRFVDLSPVLKDADGNAFKQRYAGLGLVCEIEGSTTASLENYTVECVLQHSDDNSTFTTVDISEVFGDCVALDGLDATNDKLQFDLTVDDGDETDTRLTDKINLPADRLKRYVKLTAVTPEFNGSSGTFAINIVAICGGKSQEYKSADQSEAL